MYFNSLCQAKIERENVLTKPQQIFERLLRHPAPVYPMYMGLKVSGTPRGAIPRALGGEAIPLCCCQRSEAISNIFAKFRKIIKVQ